MGRSWELPRGARAYLATGNGWPDDTGATVLHVDMDAFFASVELRDRPELRAKPVIVAGSGSRSVVTAANYPAREFGVHSAMPLATARRRCPQAVVLTPHRHSYSEVSAGVMEIFRQVTPLVEPLSLDEAFLDVSGALRRLDATPGEIGASIRGRVFAAERISCSVGVGTSKLVAKLASGMAKPDGMMIVPAAETLDFLRPLPVSALSGVGASTAGRLERIGLATVGDLASVPLSRLRRAVGAAAAGELQAMATNQDDRPVVPERDEKSIGAETTFDADIADRDLLLRELLALAERAGAALRAKELRGRTVSIKVRYPDFRTITRSRTLPGSTDMTREIYRTARELLGPVAAGGPLRLLGVRMEGLVAGERAAAQLTFDEPDRGWSEAEHAADAVRSRFGSAAVRPASLVVRSDDPTEDDGIG